MTITNHTNSVQTSQKEQKNQKQSSKQSEINGPKGLEPTRYGDWERKGRCIDF